MSASEQLLSVRTGSLLLELVDMWLPVLSEDGLSAPGVSTHMDPGRLAVSEKVPRGCVCVRVAAATSESRGPEVLRS